MKETDKKYFMNRVTKIPLEINSILGLRAQESLSETIRAELMGYVHPWQLPNISIQSNPSNNKLLPVGKVGINDELFYQDGPTFYVHKSKMGELREQ